MKLCKFDIVEVRSRKSASAASMRIMSRVHPSRRNFLKAAGAAAGATLLSPPSLLSQSARAGENWASSPSERLADYTLTIATKPIELAPNRIVSVTTYNGQFPGPLLRLKEGERVRHGERVLFHVLNGGATENFAASHFRARASA